MVYAGLLVFSFVLATGSLENLLRANRMDLYLLYALPLAATLSLYVALRPSPVRIHASGMALSRPLALRWHRPFARWDNLAAVYPVSYDVTGAFVSPFASSDGKVTQTGLGLEWPDGRIETVRFTPTRYAQNTRRSRGYREAMEIVQGIYLESGRPMVPRAETFTPVEREALLAEARRPFLPFFTIVFLFASAAPIVWLLAGPLGVPTPLALPVALLAPLGTSLQSWRASRRRNRILNRLSKSAWHQRAATGPRFGLRQDPAPGPTPADAGLAPAIEASAGGTA